MTPRKGESREDFHKRRREYDAKPERRAVDRGRSKTPVESEDRRIRRLEGEVKDLRLRLAVQIKRADKAEDLRDSVFGLTVADFAPPKWPALKTAKTGFHKPILFTSDFQYGEVVKAAEMDGMNAFNRDIFLQRYTTMIDKTIMWCDAIEQGWGAEYPEGIIYARGGDAISGEIHDELRETNDASLRGALRELAAIEAEGIRRLHRRFGHVHVVTIPGNHGRTTVKPRHKGYVNSNFETILADLIQTRFEREPGYSFQCPESGYAHFDAAGWHFELRHGDRMGAGGGVGWIGAPAPITKGHKKVILDAATTGKPVDFVLTGHYHTSMKLPRGFANGSMPGYNEYARSLGLDPDSAKQWLIFASLHHVYGIELELSKFPRRE